MPQGLVKGMVRENGWVPQDSFKKTMALSTTLQTDC